MKKTSLCLPVFLFLLAFFSCKKDFNDSVFTFVLLSGDNQQGQPNETLASDIIVQVLQDGKPFFSAPVIFEPNSGFALASTPSGFSQKVAATDATGKLHLKWTLGCLGAQEMKLRLGSPGCSQTELVAGTCTVLGEMTVKAESAAANGWTKACGLSNPFIKFDRNFTQFMEFGDDLFMLVNNNVFHSSNDGVDWDGVNTPFGQNINAVSAFSVGDNGEWYMTIFSNGLFVSQNRGTTWSNISNNIFFSQPNRIFVRGDVILVNDFGNGLFRTDNNGGTWAQIQVGSSFFGNFSQLVEAPDGKWWIWDESNGRLAKSTDNGLNWTAVNVPWSLQAFPATSMTVNADGHILYLYQDGPKLMDFNPATGTGTVKTFLDNPTGTSLVGFLQDVNGVNWLNTYVNGGPPLGIHTGTGNGAYTKVDPGTTEEVEVFYRTKKERLLIGNKNGLFVKL